MKSLLAALAATSLLSSAAFAAPRASVTRFLAPRYARVSQQDVEVAVNLYFNPGQATPEQLRRYDSEGAGQITLVDLRRLVQQAHGITDQQ